MPFKLAFFLFFRQLPDLGFCGGGDRQASRQGVYLNTTQILYKYPAETDALFLLLPGITRDNYN